MKEGDNSVTQVSNMSSPPSLPDSPTSKPINEAVVIDLCHSTPPPHRESELLNGTPLRPIFCVKNREAMKEVENREDCFILDFDPDDPFTFSSVPHKNLNNLSDDGAASPDISVVAEKGQLACRDYPHSRHLCLKYPFANTPHESYCELCYCFVCDSAAPCKKWSGGGLGHCHAVDNEAWKYERKLCKGIRA